MYCAPSLMVAMKQTFGPTTSSISLNQVRRLSSNRPKRAFSALGKHDSTRQDDNAVATRDCLSNSRPLPNSFTGLDTTLTCNLAGFRNRAQFSGGSPTHLVSKTLLPKKSCQYHCHQQPECWQHQCIRPCIDQPLRSTQCCVVFDKEVRRRNRAWCRLCNNQLNCTPFLAFTLPVPTALKQESKLFSIFIVNKVLGAFTLVNRSTTDRPQLHQREPPKTNGLPVSTVKQAVFTIGCGP